MALALLRTSPACRDHSASIFRRAEGCLDHEIGEGDCARMGPLGPQRAGAVHWGAGFLVVLWSPMGAWSRSMGSMGSCSLADPSWAAQRLWSGFASDTQLCLLGKPCGAGKGDTGIHGHDRPEGLIIISKPRNSKARELKTPENPSPAPDHSMARNRSQAEPAQFQLHSSVPRCLVGHPSLGKYFTSVMGLVLKPGMGVLDASLLSETPVVII